MGDGFAGSGLRRNRFSAGTARARKAKVRSVCWPASPGTTRCRGHLPLRKRCSGRQQKSPGSYSRTPPVSADNIARNCAKRAPGAASHAAANNLQRMATILYPAGGGAGGLDDDSFTACADDAPPEHFVYLWSLDTPRPEAAGDDLLMGTDALLHLIQAVEDDQVPEQNCASTLVTRGAQPPGRAMESTAVAQAPLVGLLRVIQNEYPNFSGRGIDLPPEASASDRSLLWNELLREDAEREIAFRGEARYVQRLGRGRRRHEDCSIRRSRCDLNPANAAISTPSALCLLPCLPAAPVKC